MLPSMISQSNVADQFRLFCPFRKLLLSAFSNKIRKSSTVYPVKWLFELNAKQREVLARRFGLLGYEAATLEDVGREIGLTRERVRQIQVEGLRRLREILQTQGLNIEALFRE